MPTKTIGAMRRGTHSVGSWISSMIRLLPSTERPPAVVVEEPDRETRDGQPVEQRRRARRRLGRPVERTGTAPSYSPASTPTTEPSRIHRNRCTTSRPYPGAARRGDRGRDGPGAFQLAVGGFGDLGHGASGGSAPAGGPAGSYRRARSTLVGRSHQPCGGFGEPHRRSSHERYQSPGLPDKATSSGGIRSGWTSVAGGRLSSGQRISTTGVCSSRRGLRPGRPARRPDRRSSAVVRRGRRGGRARARGHGRLDRRPTASPRRATCC